MFRKSQAIQGIRLCHLGDLTEWLQFWLQYSTLSWLLHHVAQDFSDVSEQPHIYLKVVKLFVRNLKLTESFWTHWPEHKN